MSLEFHPVASVGPEEQARNAALALSRGIPTVERAGHVAVVGGGPSVADHLDTLRQWGGPIWAINETFNWLKEQGIKATFLTLDPKPQPWVTVAPGDKALAALGLSPEMLDILTPADLHLFPLGDGPGDVPCSCTTATGAPGLALYMGHRSVTFFGCDSSFVGNSHVYERGLPLDMILVLCGEDVFTTKPEFLLQADALAALCRELPTFHKNRSAGLLEALIANPERTVIAATAEVLAA